MIEITDRQLWARIISEELVGVDNNRSLNTGEKISFTNALAKATARIEEQGCFMDYDRERDVLVIWSQGSNAIYEINGDKTCQCRAFLNGRICWHRAAKRLASRYLLAEWVDSEMERLGGKEYLAAVDNALTQAPYGEPILDEIGYGHA